MKTDLDRALEFLAIEEGGWSDHVHDSGGKTMYGVTQATYNRYRKAKKLPVRPVRGITKEEVRDLYDLFFWREAQCHRLPWPINYLVFDAAVNSSPKRGIQWAQRGLGVSADGVVGPATIGAAERCVADGDSAKILAIVDARVQFLCDLVKRKPTQLSFLLGWWRRTQRVLGRALLTLDLED